MTTIEIKQGIAEDGFDKSDLINICLDLCHQIECKANAEFIVRAVNAHDDLVNALSELIAARSDVYDADRIREIYENAISALAKARGES